MQKSTWTSYAPLELGLDESKHPMMRVLNHARKHCNVDPEDLVVVKAGAALCRSLASQDIDSISESAFLSSLCDRGLLLLVAALTTAESNQPALPELHVARCRARVELAERVFRKNTDTPDLNAPSAQILPPSSPRPPSSTSSVDETEFVSSDNEQEQQEQQENVELATRKRKATWKSILADTRVVVRFSPSIAYRGRIKHANKGGFCNVKLDDGRTVRPNRRFVFACEEHFPMGTILQVRRYRNPEHWADIFVVEEERGVVEYRVTRSEETKRRRKAGRATVSRLRIHANSQSSLFPECDAAAILVRMSCGASRATDG